MNQLDGSFDPPSFYPEAVGVDLYRNQSPHGIITDAPDSEGGALAARTGADLKFSNAARADVKFPSSGSKTATPLRN